MSGSLLVNCLLYCLKGSSRSELVVNIEANVVGALLSLESRAAESLVCANAPMVVDLVVHLHLDAVELIPPNGRLEVSVGGQSVLSSTLQADGSAFEVLCTVSSVVGNLEGVVGGIGVLVPVANAHEMLLEVSSEEILMLGIFGSPGKLSPESLEVLQVMLEVNTKVVLVLVGKADACLEFGLTLVVVLNVFLLKSC